MARVLYSSNQGDDHQVVILGAEPMEEIPTSITYYHNGRAIVFKREV